MTAIPVLPITRLELAFEQQPWTFAIERRAEIDAHFAEQQRLKPMLFNGRVLVLHRYAIEAGVFRGGYLETDYASFLAWNRWGYPDRSVWDCFAQGALRSADGAFLVAVMGPHTANAGQMYFPSGVPDPSDRKGRTVDLDASVWREVGEEIGLTPDELVADPGWTLAFDRQMIANIKVLRAKENATMLRERILDFLRRAREPELADVRIVRGPDDLDQAMLPFVQAFLNSAWAGGK
jgi:hypothetical protein